MECVSEDCFKKSESGRSSTSREAERNDCFESCKTQEAHKFISNGCKL